MQVVAKSVLHSFINHKSLIMKRQSSIIKTYVASKSTFFDNGTLTVKLDLYRRVLEDGTDLHRNYNIGRAPMCSCQGSYCDIKDIHKSFIAKCDKLGIPESDIEFIS